MVTMMKMMLLPLLALLALRAACQKEDRGYDFGQDIRQFAVAAGNLYVATDDALHQLAHDLRPNRSVSLRRLVKAAGSPYEPRSGAGPRNSTFQIHVFLPFVRNRTLITCGVYLGGCGYCELLDLEDISKVVHGEEILVGPTRRSSQSVAMLVNVTGDNSGKAETYILTAVNLKEHTAGKCPFYIGTLDLSNTDDKQRGGIFSVTSDSINAQVRYKGNDSLEFVDGFQVGAAVYLIFNNVSARDVRLLWFEGNRGKAGSLMNIRGGVLAAEDAGRSAARVLASALVPGLTPVLWVGVFAVDAGGETKTQLVLFDISTDLSGRTEKYGDFSLTSPPGSVNITVQPRAVIYRQNNMTAVLAVKQKAWTVFFIGTDDGQLIKLAVDQNLRSPCPSVLYRSNDDQTVFPKLQLDQTDHKHIYVPFQKQIKRMPVARCRNYATVQDCWSAQDPHCVWCISESSCTFEDKCQGLDWLSIPDVFEQKMISHQVVEEDTNKIKLIVQAHVSLSRSPASNFTCGFTTNAPNLCTLEKEEASPLSPQCTCTLQKSSLPAEGLHVRISIKLWTTHLSQQVKIFNCSNMIGPPTSSLCLQCLEAGCGWSENGCTWADPKAGNVGVCLTLPSGRNYSTPIIASISPSIVSFYGKKRAKLTGSNLSDVTGVRIRSDVDCKPRESPVWDKTGHSLTFEIPKADNKGTVKVCVLLPDGTCHGSTTIVYRSLPSCNNITPNSSWFSGNRMITLIGSHLEFVDGVVQSHTKHQIQTWMGTESQNLTFNTSQAENGGVFQSQVHLIVANQRLKCSHSITYYPEPEFSNFTTIRVGDSVLVTIEKKADKLDVSPQELSVWGVQKGRDYKCDMQKKETTNDTDFFTCEIEQTSEAKFEKLKILYGNKQVLLTPPSLAAYSMLGLLFIAPIPFIVILVVLIYRRKQRMLAQQMDKRMEELELDIRNDIRQGFVDLQTEKADLLENVGAIPFLDYKHFAAKIFFPESESMMVSCIKDIGQDVVQVRLDEGCQGMSRLIHNRLFLTSMVHALEEQKSFSIKDRCVFASLLTVALHSDLPYLTEVMEVLLRDLMQQRGATQPKLLLRRTESIVEKLLSNWMSICLYGFLRETAGQHLFLIVSALTQQTAKGPVDCVTGKALYTLSEDWLLWQAQDFAPLKLKVLFAVGCDGEVSEPLEVCALDCDTVEQLKGKILDSFKNKFGFPYCTPIRELCVEHQKNGSFVPLEEVDASSVVLGEVTMLNTLKHYQVADGATIKVLSQKIHPPLSPQGSLKDDENFSGKYFHLIDPEDVEDQRANPERKKLKLKEVHLTKLISTKVAVHSFVENLFKSIWGATQCKAPMAVRYFFDFLDTQAENMKVNDPDVLHIWKTNSLPLRYWVNIIKNPQFVFDMEKTAHLDGCLSVIAQAFMDSFSLSDALLGKYAPTNKLLYAKDIPKFKQEVKSYYKQIRDQSPIPPSEFKSFLLEESKKHENEFNQAVALRELHKFIQRYLTEIKEKLDQNGAPAELKEQLHHIKTLFDGQKSCSWN